MRYNVLVDETYVNNPIGIVHVNGRTIHTCNTLNEVLALITETSKKLHKECDVLREWSCAEQGSVVHKILYTRRKGTGRLLTKFKVNMVTKVVYNDSLI